MPPGTYSVVVDIPDAPSFTLENVVSADNEVTDLGLQVICRDTDGDGCEVHVASDTANCGDCGSSCYFPQATSACVGGACRISSCQSGWANCNVDTSDGCETSSGTDPANCGDCGITCATGELCVDGLCV